MTSAIYLSSRRSHELKTATTTCRACDKSFSIFGHFIEVGITGSPF